MGRYTNVRKGLAEDLGDGKYYASGWERDFARVLTYLRDKGFIEGFEYEPMTFSFQSLGYRRGPFTYIPDFAVKFGSKVPKQLKDLFPEAEPHKVVFMEVKGQEKGSDRSKWRRFRKHSGYSLEIIKREKMIELQKLFKKAINEWESNIY